MIVIKNEIFNEMQGIDHITNLQNDAWWEGQGHRFDALWEGKGRNLCT